MIAWPPAKRKRYRAATRLAAVKIVAGGDVFNFLFCRSEEASAWGECEGQTWDPQGQYQTARSSLAGA